MEYGLPVGDLVVVGGVGGEEGFNLLLDTVQPRHSSGHECIMYMYNGRTTEQ